MRIVIPIIWLKLAALNQQTKRTGKAKKKTEELQCKTATRPRPSTALGTLGQHVGNGWDVRF